MESVNNLVWDVKIGRPARSRVLDQFGYRVMVENLLLASEVSLVSGQIRAEVWGRVVIDA